MFRKKKTIVVFGAGGSIGNSVVKLLEKQGHRVIKVVHTKAARNKIVQKNPHDECRFADVGNYPQVKRVVLRLKQDDITVDGVIYAVGKYEKGGYINRIKRIASEFSSEILLEEITTQFTGLRHVFEAIMYEKGESDIPVIAEGGHLIFVSSVTHEDFPDNHDTITYEEQERRIELMRNDFRLKHRHNIHIHHLGFGRIHTHYYHSAELPEKILSLDYVAKEIVSALDFTGHTSFTKVP